MTVIALRPRPAYTPLDPPTTCMTPGHEGREARNYPGGRLCKKCITTSRLAMNGSDETGGPE